MVPILGLLAGCTDGGGSPAATSEPAATVTVTATASASASAPSAPTASASATASAPASASASPSASGSATALAGCDTTALTGEFAADAQGAAAGSDYYDLSLVNRASSPCTLQGWPGVSFTTSSGRQIGAAADFDRSTAHGTVTLIPNGRATALVQVAVAENFPAGACGVVTAAHLRVYPPGSRASLAVALPKALRTCSDAASHVLRVGALHAGG